MLALLDIRGMAPLERLSVRDGKSSLDARSTKSLLGSPRYRVDRGKFSNVIWSGSGDEIMEAEVVLPSVEDAY